MDTKLLSTLLEKRQAVNSRIVALSDKKKEYDDAIKNVLGTPQKFTIGTYHVSWTESVSRRVDTKKIKAEFPDVAEKCTVESKSTRLTISEKKPLDIA